MKPFVTLCALFLLGNLSGCGEREEAVPAPMTELRPQDGRTRLTQFFGPSDSRPAPRDIFAGEATQATAAAKRGKQALPLLAGIVLQGGVPAAFFLNGGQSQTGREGDLVAGRYRVVKIDSAYVVLKDLSSGKAYQVLLTGS